MILTNIKQLVGIQSESKHKVSGIEMNQLNTIENAYLKIDNDDLENMGPAKVADVEGTQQKIIKVVKKLEEEGKLIMAGAGDDVV